MSETNASKDSEEAFNERGFLKRTCRLQKKEIIQEVYSDLEVEEGEISDDTDSDKDYDPNAPRVKKKKKKKVKLKAEDNEKPRKERRQKKKQDFKPPSFDQVMKTQISHLARFIEYDEYDSCEEESSEFEEITMPEPIRQEEKIPEPLVQKEKKKRIVIYPWRPIGITSGSLSVEEAYLTTREPVNDVRQLIELENIF